MCEELFAFFHTVLDVLKSQMGADAIEVELVKKWVTKGQSSFLQILHISPIPPILQQNPSNFLPYIVTKNNLKVISTELQGVRLTPNVSTTFSKLKMKKLILMP